MGYKIKWNEVSLKNLKSLDNSIKKQVMKFIDKLKKVEDAKAFGKKLKYSSVGNWRYRVGNYRIIADIQDDKLVILIIAIGHRSIIYDELNKRFNK